MNYIEILEDTLLAFRLPVYQKTAKRKPTSRPKLYFFDIGVVHALRRSFPRELSAELFGKFFEHFIILEVRAYLSYHMRDETLSFWRSQTGFEADLVVGDSIAVEIKAAQLVSDRHLKGLRALREDLRLRRAIVVSMDARRRLSGDGIEILPWKDFLAELWGHGILE